MKQPKTVKEFKMPNTFMQGLILFWMLDKNHPLEDLPSDLKLKCFNAKDRLTSWKSKAVSLECFK